MQTYTFLFYLCLFLFSNVYSCIFCLYFYEYNIYFYLDRTNLCLCIYHNVKLPMNLTYIYLFSFIQISSILYFKGNPNNILHLKPFYIKVTIICTILLIETLILTFQEIIVPKFFIPDSFKENSGMEFKYNSQLNEEQKENICSICLFYQ